MGNHRQPEHRTLWFETLMVFRWPSWLLRWAADLLTRGCKDTQDPECRRRAALLNLTALSGIGVSAVFLVANILAGRTAAAIVLGCAISVMLVALYAYRAGYSTTPATWVGVSSIAVFFLFLLTREQSQNVGLIWASLFPLIAMLCLGHNHGTLLSGIYLGIVGLVFLVPDLQETSTSPPLSLTVRLLVAIGFAMILAYYYQKSNHTAQARLRAEIDIRRRTEAMLLATGEEALRASQAKSDFLASLSHEVRTPLTTIMGVNEILLDNKPTESQRRYLELAGSAGRGLIAVMEDILDLARVEAGKLSLQVRAFNLRVLARDIIAMQQALAQKRPLDVTLDWQARDLTLMGDPHRLRQILTNLTGNALKFTQAGSVCLRVQETATTPSHVTLRLSVIDTGTGLPPELQATVFEPFAQGEAARHQGGTGLGLAISKRLIEAMGGSIGVTSTPGVGSNFWIQLSLPIAAEPRDSTPSPTTAYQGNVLVVEDNDVNREVLRVMIERSGCRVDTATNGADAVSRCGVHCYDLVLMDCQMPVLDGFEATRRIREQEANGHHTPIVAITAYGLPEDTRRCEAAGMDGHLIKPLTAEQVSATLSKWLTQRT